MRPEIQMLGHPMQESLNVKRHKHPNFESLWEINIDKLCDKRFVYSNFCAWRCVWKSGHWGHLIRESLECRTSQTSEFKNLWKIIISKLTDKRFVFDNVYAYKCVWKSGCRKHLNVANVQAHSPNKMGHGYPMNATNTLDSSWTTEYPNEVARSRYPGTYERMFVLYGLSQRRQSRRET